jgi:hypothetical protein
MNSRHSSDHRTFKPVLRSIYDTRTGMDMYIPGQTGTVDSKVFVRHTVVSVTLRVANVD